MVSPQSVAAWLVGLTTLHLASTAPAIGNSITSSQDSDRAALAPVFGKRFLLDHCDNTVGAMQAAGVNESLSRTFAESVTFSISLDEEDGEYTLSSDIYFKVGDVSLKLLTSKETFRIGQEVEMKTIDQSIVKALFTQDGNTLTEVRKGKLPATIVRTFTPEHVKTITEIGGAVNHCVYKPE